MSGTTMFCTLFSWEHTRRTLLRYVLEWIDFQIDANILSRYAIPWRQALKQGEKELLCHLASIANTKDHDPNDMIVTIQRSYDQPIAQKIGSDHKDTNG